ncbi:MAG: VCBS repeat-containing protein [Planctomycetes bacterium]|nr:VCBS repeat-containing protein [Planctomycetota bacterium]
MQSFQRLVPSAGAIGLLVNVTFAQAPTFAIHSIPNQTNLDAVAAGDFDGDGRPDVVTLMSSSGANVHFGDGAGGFGASITISIADAPASAGGFGPPMHNKAGGTCNCAAFGDLNADGNVDCETAETGTATIPIGYIYSLLGNGAGTFTGAAANGSGSAAYFVTLGDVNHDGAPDAAMISGTVPFIVTSIVLGPLAQPAATVLHPASADLSCYAIATGDLTGDGNPDLIITKNSGSLAVSFAAGDGAGHFGNSTVYNTGSGAGLIAICDLNRDGAPDCIISNLPAGALTTLVELPPAAAGLITTGTGTPGCRGVLALSANATPKVNSPNFGLICTNAPENSLGLGLASVAQYASGQDPFGVGILLYVDILNSPMFTAFDFFSDSSGTAFVATPLPNDAAVAGIVIYAQGVWLESTASGHACSASPLHLVSSTELSITIQP